MAAMSNQSEYRLLSGDHNLFFTVNDHQAVIDAIDRLLSKLNNSNKKILPKGAYIEFVS